MSVNGITGVGLSESNYISYAKTQKTSNVKTEKTASDAENSAATADKVASKSEKTTTKTEKPATTAEEAGAIYESSSTTENSKTAHTQNTAMIEKLKADADAKTAQLQSLVEKLMLGQGNSYATATDMWAILKNGELTVDPATREQAQADISESGYWGVTQTSDRILDFAKALSGGDSSKLEELRSAFEKGFKQAEKTWGGKLPEISQKTYEETMKKFDAWAAESTSISQ